MDGFDLEQQVFCYFIMGTAFPLIWGSFFLIFTMEPSIFDFDCTYIINWGYVTAVFLFLIAFFYLILIIWSLCAFE